jgi:hypothetical protein
MADQNDFIKTIQYSLQLLFTGILGLLALLFVITLSIFYPPEDSQSSATATTVVSRTNATIEEPSVLADDPNIDIIKTNCTACHSAKLIVQNRATREGWKSMIVWMQKNQKLWDLGNNEDLILDYLAKNYAPEDKGRRSNLKEIEWYQLD